MDLQNNNNDSFDTPKTTGPSNNKWFFLILVGFLMLVFTFRIGYVVGQEGLGFDSTQFKFTGGDVGKGLDFGLLNEAINTVSQKYIDRESIDQEKILYGAIRGAVSAAGDEYTEFFDPKTFSDFKTELQGSFDGIGAEIGKRDNNIVIIAPLDGSPAQRAGLQPSDIIVEVDGESMADKTTNEAVSKIRGQKGTEVTLTLYREGGNGTFEVKIVREKIEVKSVKLEYLEGNGKQIALITVSRFGDDTQSLFASAIEEIKARQTDGVILDLRNNPGGYLEASVALSSHWLELGKLVVKEAHSEKDVLDYNSTGSNQLGGYKTIVLINGGSASASEIVAGALKDNGKATLLGEKSFGKGSVQELIPLSGGSAVKVTIAKWITPSGQSLNKEGLNPDIEVARTEEDFEADRDPQLDRALEEIIK